MPTATTMQRVIITIPPALLAQVEDAAAKLNFSRSRLIREALTQYVEAQQQLELRELLKEGYVVHAAAIPQLSGVFRRRTRSVLAIRPGCRYGVTSMYRPCRRGEIYYADLDPIVGHEQAGRRPVLIIQNDTGNLFSPTIIVAAFTTALLPSLIRPKCESQQARYSNRNPP